MMNCSAVSLALLALFLAAPTPSLARDSESLESSRETGVVDRRGEEPQGGAAAKSFVHAVSHELIQSSSWPLAIVYPQSRTDPAEPRREEGLRVAENLAKSDPSCPRGAGHSDGCEGAQSSGSVQHVDFFSGYTGVQYPDRPGWNVAGVDYPVGHAGDLKDPSLSENLPACAKYSSNTVTINSDAQPCVLDHLDFSLHGGMCLTIKGVHGHTVSFTNDRFFPNVSVCPYYIMSLDRGEYSNIEIAHSDISDDRKTPIIGDIFLLGKGQVTLRYNNFQRIACRIVNTGEGSTASVTLEYNYLEGIGSNGECHGETVEYNSAETVDLHIENFNTYYQPADTCWTGKACDTSFAYITSAAPGPKGPGAMTAAQINNNVMISRLTTEGAVAIGGLLWLDTTFNNTIGSVRVNNNYIDPAGSYFAILVHAGGDFPGSIGDSICVGNKLISGRGASAIVGLMGKGASTMRCQ